MHPVIFQLSRYQKTNCMNIKIILLFCFLFIYAFKNEYAQSIDYKSIELYVDSVSFQKNNFSFEKLVPEIVKSDWGDESKVFAIFYWIASNIKYDNEGFNTGKWIHYTSDYDMANDTYKYKKGVCSGYSYLFKFMCAKIGVEAKVINGYSRTDIFQAGLPIERTNHSWNIVKISGNWQFVDATWASITSEEGKINNYYFLTPPIEFVANHFPEEEDLQLLEKPISKEQFDNYPFISSDYFMSGFDKSFPKNGLLTTNIDTITIVVNSPNDLKPIIMLYNFNIEKWVTPLYRDTKLNNCIKFYILLKEKGKYLLQIDAFNQDSESFNIKKGLLYFTLIRE